MKANKTDGVLIRLLYLCVTAMVILQLVSLSAITTLLFYTTFIIVVAVWVSMLLREVDRVDVLCLVIILFTIFNVLLNALLCNTPLGFGYLKKMIMFCSSVVFFRIGVKLDVGSTNLNFITRCVDVISCIFTLAFLVARNAMYMFGGRLSPYVTFRFTNPNLASMFLVCFAMIEFIGCIHAQNTRSKWFHGVLAAIMAFFVLETDARNAEIALALFVVMIFVLLLKKRKQAYKISMPIAVFTAVFPMLFFNVYLALINTPFISDLFSFISSANKELTSRVYMWTLGTAAYKKSPIIGAYSQISYGTGQSQLHNTHLDIMASYGTFILVLVCALLAVLIHNKNFAYKNKVSIIPMLGFISVLMLGLGEAALFSGGFGLYIFAGALLLFTDKECVALPSEDQE